MILSQGALTVNILVTSVLDKTSIYLPWSELNLDDKDERHMMNEL